MPIFVMARERFNFTELRSNYTLKFSDNLLVLDHFSSQSSKIAAVLYCLKFWGWSSVAETTMSFLLTFFLAATQVNFPLNNKFSFLCFKQIFLYIITTSLFQLHYEYISFKIFHFILLMFQQRVEISDYIQSNTQSKETTNLTFSQQTYKLNIFKYSIG